MEYIELVECGVQSASTLRELIDLIGIGTVKVILSVALLAEGVDRNRPICNFWVNLSGSPSSRRAWIEIDHYRFLEDKRVSPSSRRAWIEIRLSGGKPQRGRVALLAEGVDRNAFC